MNTQSNSECTNKNAGAVLASLCSTSTDQSQMNQVMLGTCHVGIMNQAPVIDGSLDEDKWREAAGFDGLIVDDLTDPRKTRVYIGATLTHLYFAFETELPPWNNLEADDAVGVLIGGGQDSGQKTCYHFEVRPEGKIVAYKQCVRNGEESSEEIWNPEWRVVNRQENGFWLCEIEAPIQSVGRTTAEGDWQLNVIRRYHHPDALATLSQQDPESSELACFHFSSKSPAIQYMQRLLYTKDPGMGDVDTVLNVSNPGTEPIKISAAVGLQCAKRQPILKEENFEIAPGETRKVFLMVEAVASLQFSTYALVCDTNGNVMYAKHNQYRRHRQSWITPAEPSRPCDFRFAYYPSLNTLRVEATRGPLPDNADFSSMAFSVRPSGGGEPVKEFTLKADEFNEGCCEVLIDLPQLDGDYEIIAQATGTGVPPEPRIQHFQRKRFPWEGLNLGMSKKVYPPFTPIRVEGNSLFTVLKEYRVNDCGLLDQVITAHQEGINTEPLLAAPMQYTGSVAGRDCSPESASFSLESKAEDTVSGCARFVLGGIHMQASLLLDFDGMLKVDLTIEPSSGKQIDRLDIEIPLRSELARLLHAVSVRYRDVTLSEPLPEEEGLIWSAKQLPPGGWVDNFCTYLFVGDPARGLSWFVDNDCGWLWDPNTPNVEIIRTGTNTTLHIHLINTPSVIETPRTITFGLQAAPVKPRIKGWRYKWYTDQYSVLGCDPHWFGLGSCSNVYPAGKGLFLWELLKRCNEERLSDKEIDEAVVMVQNYFEPYSKKYGEAFVNRILKFARQNLRNRHGKKMIFYYNRASFRGAEEFQTFVDEWGKNDYNEGHRGIDDRIEQFIVPVESWIDHSLYWYGTAFDIGGNTGVYMDNVFLVPIHNRMMTGAYRREDNSISPSTGLWALRSMARRTFQYMNECGMLPIHMVHMTSLQILPLNGLYTIQYDWEWQREMGAVHTRFPRDYMLLVSNGEHAGNWPIVLHEVGRLSHDPWILKTFLGVTIIHELIVDPYFWPFRPVEDTDVAETQLFKTFRQPILNLLQKPDVEVYRYWDTRPQPLYATHPDLPTIVFARKGLEAIVAITSYADNDETVELHIDPVALGFKSDAYRIADMETGENLPHPDNTVQFPLKQYDLKEFRLLPE